MQRRNLIAAGWNSYRQLLPPDVGHVQLKETRQAFYAGAAVLLESIMHSLSPDPDTTPDDEAVFMDVQLELREFGQQLDASYGLGPRGQG